MSAKHGGVKRRRWSNMANPARSSWPCPGCGALVTADRLAIERMVRRWQTERTSPPAPKERHYFPTSHGDPCRPCHDAGTKSRNQEAMARGRG